MQKIDRFYLQFHGLICQLGFTRKIGNEDIQRTETESIFMDLYTFSGSKVCSYHELMIVSGVWDLLGDLENNVRFLN